MTVLVWDRVGERTYQTGVDKGVLYLPDGRAVVWNGLTSVEETPNSESQSFHLDGVKYLGKILPGDYLGKLKAFTYPEEFELVNGVRAVAPGLVYYDQPPRSFNLSYRTRLGNDQHATEHGYKIHLLYNVLANPDAAEFMTLGEQVQPAEFAWELSGIPSKVPGYRPTAHISIDSTTTNPDILEIIEHILYGSEETEPRFPSLEEVTSLFKSIGSLIIVDNGDGTWDAIDMSNEYITMLDETTFQIDNANAVYLDTVTYEISTTTPEEPEEE